MERGMNMAKGVGSGNNPNSRKGTKNLIPITERSVEEQRELRVKGGKRSGEVRKAKAEARKAAEMVLYELKINDKGREALDLKGADLSSLPDAEKIDGMTGLMISLLLNGMNGSAEAAKVLLNIAGVNDEETDEVEKATTGVIMLPLRGDEESEKE